MAKRNNNSILGLRVYSNLNLFIIICLIKIVFFCCSYEVNADSFPLSGYTYSRTELNPYDWRYLRVDLPPWFSTMTISLDSDVDLDPNSIRTAPKSDLPMICVREGSPPLPDAHNTSLTNLGPISNESLGIEGLQFAERCFAMQKNIFLQLTNEQISPGVWYFGLFNGIGSMRTQSKMINRGQGFSFNGNVSVEGCMTEMVSGRFCNQAVHQLLCAKNYNKTAENVASCRNDEAASCSSVNEPKTYSLDVLGIVEAITINAMNIRFNQTLPSNNTGNSSSIALMYYVRHGAIPSSAVHDYSGNIMNASLVIQSPKVGRWYITVIPLFNLSNEVGGVQNTSMKVCYSLESQVLQCPVNKAGLNCTWERYILQTILRKNPSVPFESYYLPISDKISSVDSTFIVEPLLSNSSFPGNSDLAWTYFLVDIPYDAAGGSIHVQITSDTKISHEVYAAYGGLPLEAKYDYYYANSTSNSNGSMFFKLYDGNEKTISFYLLYVRGGTWGFGLKHFNTAGNASKSQTSMSISLERCPKRCSSHGTCQNVVEMSGLTLYSYCSCDRNHGGFDCSVEIVSHRGHIWQSVALIASNAAAILPAYWALRRKAFAEWVLYTSSGISSGLYHACDVGTWCALSFHVLQFLDFWLSFMAVVSTFVYLATISEVSKRTIHTIVAILTALMAETGATRSSNIVLVIAIGASGLLVGWLIEFLTHHRTLTFSIEFFLNMLHQWERIKGWVHNLIKTILKRFRWGFILAGFVALAMAAISWTLESSESYWLWHSLWHVSIYTSSFLFLCSKVNDTGRNCENQEPPNADYELTRQDSFPRGQEERADAQNR